MSFVNNLSTPGIKFVEVFKKTLCAAFFFVSAILFADQKPSLYVRNFLTEETGAHHQNWKIITDKNGFILSGNNAGIVVFDGRKWKMTSNNNFTPVKSLHRDPINNKIFYGGIGEFGLFGAVGKGYFQYQPIKVDSSIFRGSFADIWKIHQTGSDIFFQAFSAIFRLRNGKITAILPKNEFHLSFSAGNKILVQEPSEGLKMIQGDSAVLMKGGAYFLGDKIYSILPLSSDEYQLVSRKYGLIKVLIRNNEINHTPDKLRSELPPDIYCSLKMSDSLFAYGSLSEGLFLVNEDGKVMEVFNSSNGLKNQSVKDIFLDEQKGIWLALESGITRVDYTFPIRFFSGSSGVSASVQSIAHFNQTLFLATSQGIFKSQSIKDHDYSQSFIEIPGVKNQVFQLLKADHQTLYASGVDGIFQINQTGLKKIAVYRAYSLALAPWDSSLLMVGCFDGLSMLRRKSGVWEDLGYVNEEEVPIRKMAFDERGDLWFTSSDTLIKRIVGKDLKAFSVKGGSLNGKVYQPRSSFDNSFSIQPFFVSGQLLVGGHGEIYSYHAGKDALIPFRPEIFKKVLGEGEVFRIYEENQRLWIYQNYPGNNLLGFLNLNQPKTGFHSGLFSILRSKVIQDISADGKGNILFGTSDGLFFFNPNHRFPIQPYSVVLQEVLVNTKDTLLLNCTGETAIPVPQISFKQNSISFSFSALFYSSPELTRFSSRLIGYDSTFSDWSLENRRNFTNLPEGDYIFEVKALNIVGTPSRMARYAFTILPPWYRTGWAYGGYTLSAVLLTLGLVRISVYRLTKAKKTLEQLVRKRTSEIVKQKEEIEKQKHLVDLRNKDITDSINYAQRIQQAILPVMDEIHAALPQGFILFLPRDIVSGDFFWFSNKYRDSHHFLFLAAVDCTGHGVPGAFMSMIGNTLLNEIVNEKGILEPSLILQFLNEGVRRALKQNNDDNASRDGMDLALIRLNIRNGELHYAGANRPLWIFRNDGTFEDHKPDKMAIGGIQSSDLKIFKTIQTNLSEGDRFFVFTDGFADQFGGPDGKKFMVKKLQQALASLHSTPLSSLEDILLEIHLKWKATHEQVDDILMMGFSLPDHKG